VRGRAGRAALPGLVVLVLVAVVAVAATGSVPRGSSESRAPSEALLDTLFTLWILAVLAGAVLLVYGLMQRQAIAKQVARGGYPRFTVVSFLVFAGVLAVLVWLFANWRPRGFNPVEEEGVFGRPGEPLPPAPGAEARQYEPSLSWIPVAVVTGLVVAAAVAYVVASRRTRPIRDPQAELAEELAAALEDALDDLRAEADPRRAIIAAYARLERVLAANGVARLGPETPDEYLLRVLRDLELTPAATGRLTALFTQAKFSNHAVDSTMKESAIAALEQVRDELRSLRDAPPAPEARAPEAVTS
jgi:uncharacterized protein DUF4129